MTAQLDKHWLKCGLFGSVTRREYSGPERSNRLQHKKTPGNRKMQKLTNLWGPNNVMEQWRKWHANSKQLMANMYVQYYMNMWFIAHWHIASFLIHSTVEPSALSLFVSVTCHWTVKVIVSRKTLSVVLNSTFVVFCVLSQCLSIFWWFLNWRYIWPLRATVRKDVLYRKEHHSMV